MRRTGILGNQSLGGLVGALCVVAAAALPASAFGSEHVTVVQHDGMPYGTASAPRARVAQKFYETHGDAYDFLVVLPTFDVDLGQEVGGYHIVVRNAVQGIGLPSPHDVGAQYGSATRLKGYVDVLALNPDALGTSVESAASILAHEVAHQWSGRVAYLDPVTQARRTDLVGREGAHWSFFLDSDASVLYGSEWTQEVAGSFTSARSRTRYSNLDLYLMGLLGPDEVGPLTLLTPGAQVPHQAVDLPPADGTRIDATARTLSINDIIAAEGARVPAVGQSQKSFRAAFILMTPQGQQATPAQVAFVDELRRSFSNSFFFLTRGRAVFETALVELPPSPGTAEPSLQRGIDYLVARQKAEGFWADGDGTGTRWRETQVALEALALSGLSPSVTAATGRGGGYLAATMGSGVDDAARRVLGLVAARQTPESVQAALTALTGQLGWWTGGGAGLSQGYTPTVIDSVLAARALVAAGATAPQLTGLTEFLLARQSMDGSWPLLVGGPGRVEPTALVMEMLARLPRTPATYAAAGKAAAFLESRRNPGHLYGDERPSAAATAQALLALKAWSRLSSADAATTAGALLGVQRDDGSWESSVHATAWVVQAVRTALTPNLSLAPLDVALSASTVVEGEAVLATVSVHNFGGSRADGVQVQAFDANGTSLGAPQTLPSIEAGATGTVVLTLDTTGQAGATQVFIVVDAPQVVDETREDDNRVAVPLTVELPPALLDLVVSAGSVSTSPVAISQLPTTLTAIATLRNLSVADADSVEVALLVHEVPVATTTVALAGRASVPVTLTGSVASAPSAVEVSIVVDPRKLYAEGNEDNNMGTVQVPVTPSIDVGVANLTVTPSQTQQGQDVSLSFRVVNAGTVDAPGTTVRLTIESSGGATLATLPSQSVTVPAGGSVQRDVTWRANLAGSLVAKVQVLSGQPAPADGNPANDIATAAFTVDASTLANLDIPAGGLSLSPLRPLQQVEATATVVVRNGGASAAGPFFVDFFEGPTGGTDSRFARREVTSVAAGESVTVSAPFTVAEAAQAAVRVELDADLQVQEIDEMDNRAVVSFQPVPLAELVVGSADIQPEPVYPRSGMDVPVTVSVLNSGGQDAAGAVVELYLGEPGSGGALLGSQPLALVPAGERAEATFTWSTTGLTGEQRLVAVVNPSQAVSEGRYDNNRAERRVRVQDSALALSHLFFSPNGDGVKDATEVSYRLAAPSAVDVEVRNAAGVLVRTLMAEPAEAGTVSWDGRDAQGRVTRDGSYQLAVRASASSGKTDLGMLVAVVDNNRSRLEDAPGSQWLLEKTLEPSAGSGVTRRGRLAFAPDDSGIYFVGQRQSGSAQMCSMYFQSLEGGSPERVQPEWDCDIRRIYDVSISPDGKTLLFPISMSSCGYSNQNCGHLGMQDLDTKKVQTLAHNEKYKSVSGYVVPIFSHDSQRVVFSTLAYNGYAWRHILEVIDRTGANRRTLKALSVLDPAEYMSEGAFSPDGQMFSFRVADHSDYIADRVGVFAVGIEGGTPRQVGPLNYPSRTETTTYVGGRRHIWSTDSELIYGSNDELFAVAPLTGVRRTVFKIPFGDWDGRLFTRQLYSLSLDGLKQSLYFTYSKGSDKGLPWEIWSVPLEGGPGHPFYTAPVGAGVQDLQISPQGSFLSVVLAPGGYRAVSSLENLGVRVVATRKTGSSSLTLHGTAMDKNFESYEVSVRAMPSGTPTVIARSNQPMLNGTLAEWTPSAPGMYEVMLKATDKAGNVRTSRTLAAWTSTPLLANLWREPEFLSPNGDGVQDVSELHYTNTAPLTTQFEFVSSAGTAVRHVSVTHTGAGDQSFSWDGRNDQGVAVEDGVYTARTEGASLRFVVDSSPPDLELRFSKKLPAEQNPPEGDVFAYGFADALSQPEGHRLMVPAVQLRTSWRAEDANLVGWTLEQRAPASVNDFTTVSVGQAAFTQTKVEVLDRPLRLRSLSGRALRLKAWDKAGNARTTLPLSTPEAMFVTALGEAAEVGPEYGHLLLDGRQVPRIDRLTPLMDANGFPHVFAFAPQHYAFALDHSSDSPLVSFAVRYTRRETGQSQLDTQNVNALGDAVVLWDARALAPGAYDVDVEATAADGQLFRARVRFEAQLSELRVCTAPSGVGESSKVTLTLFTAASFLLEPGAAVDFVAPSSSQPERTYSLDDMVLQARPDGTATLEANLDTSGLTGCQYRARFRGRTVLGQRLDTEKTVNLCGTFLTGAAVTDTGASLTFAETFRKPVSAMEVFVQGGGSSTWRSVGTLGAFNGTAPALAVTSDASWACSEQKVRVVTYFADGSAPVDSEAHSENTCTASATFDVPCTRVKVESVARVEGRAPACTPQDPHFTVAFSASAEGGGNVREIAAWVRPHASTTVTPVVVEPFTAAPRVETTGTFSSAGLPDGRYLVTAQATDSLGLTVTDMLDAVTAAVDRQAPSTVLDVPASQAVVCPVRMRDAQGRQRTAIEVRGTISDNLLDGYAVLLGEAGHPLEQQASTFYAIPQARTVTGLLAQVDTSRLASGDYEMRLSAWDASGGSYCSPVRTFRYVAGVDISRFAAATDFVAPDQGGTTLDATLTEDATVTVTLARLTGEVEGPSLGTLYQGSFVAGANTVAWDGRGPAGSALADGDYVLRLTAGNACGAETSRTTRVRVDAQAPVARIDSPAGGSVQGTVTVRGEASDTNFLDYQLFVGEGTAPTSYTLVQAASAPATGALGTVDTARLQPGPHTLRLVVRDTAGYTSTALATVDVSARGVLGGFSLARSVLSPNGDGAQDVTQAGFRLLSAATVRLEVVDAGGQVVGLPLASTSRDAGEHTAPLELALLQPLPDGEYRVRLVATAGATTEEAEAPLTLDRQVPDVAVTAPQPGAIVRASVDAVGSIDDPHLETWTVLHTSPAGTTSTVASGTAPVNGKLSALTSLAEGSHTLTVRATDVAGNFRETVIAFSVDATPPVVAFTAPLDGAVLTGLDGLVPVTATLEEPHLRRLTLELLRGDGSAPELLASWSEFPGDSILLRWDVAGAADGDVTLLLKVEDQAGNTGESRIALTLDSTLPQAHITSPRDSVLLAAGTISGTATDERLAEYHLELSDGVPATAARFVTLVKGTSPVAESTLATLAKTPADGDYTLRLTVKDRAGNERVDVAGFFVDRAPPSAPAGLTAQVRPPNDVTLTWTASGDADLVGYRVLRAEGEGPMAPIGTGLVSGTTFAEDNLSAAEYRYAVVAVDRAQQQSPPSPEAAVDFAPPAVALDSPADGMVVSGQVQVKGRAFSLKDFREYRLSVGAGALPTAFTQLARGTAPIPGDVLLLWDTSTVPQGSQHTLLLEAEDTSGNVADARVVVQVDNTAPAAPVLLSATASGSSVTVQWTANTETDLAGYLLLANGAPANAPDGASPGNYLDFLLPAGTTQFIDAGLLDGELEYQLYAVDVAGSLSAPSQPRTAIVETRAPVAMLVTPSPYSRLSGPVAVQASTTDLDVAQVQFEARAAGQGAFVPLGPAATNSPYSAMLDPAQFAAPVLELRAVATDTRGNVDPAPTSILVSSSPDLVAPTVTARATGSAVDFSWTDSNPSGLVLGFDVRRGGTSLLPEPPRPAATASASSSVNGSTPAQGFDGNSNTAWQSGPGLPQTWEMEFGAPVPLESLRADLSWGSTVQVFLKLNGTWVPMGKPVVASRDYVSLSLPQVWGAEGVRLQFLSGSNTTGVSLSEVTLGLARLTTSASFSEVDVPEGTHAYQVVTVGKWGPRAEGTAQARVYRPDLDWPAQTRVATPTVRLSGYSPVAEVSIDIQRDGAVVAQAEADTSGMFEVQAPLQMGENVLSAVARDTTGSRSMESYPVYVTRVPPPSAGVTLAPAEVSGLSVALAFSVSGDTVDVAGFEVWRASGAAPAEMVATLAADARTHLDPGLRNGTYTYTVVAVNEDGFSGTHSNAVSATVDVPLLAPPESLAVSAPATGGMLALTWTHAAGGAAGFLVERALAEQGPFTSVMVAATPDTTYTDRRLVNGTRYYYRVFAVDGGGNRSSPSVVASGVPGDTQAPDAPWLKYPTASGTPIVLSNSVTEVVGTAEPLSWVDLYRNGRQVGRTQAGALKVQTRKKTLALSRRSIPALSADGRKAAYAYQESSSVRGIAVEDLETGGVVKSTLPGANFQGTPAFSPDGTRLAMEAQSTAGETHVYLVDVATGAVQPLLAAPTGQEFAPTWAPDASRVAVQYRDADGIHSLMVVELATGVQQALPQEAGMNARSPVWLRDGRHLVAILVDGDGLYHLRRFDTQGDTHVDIFTSPDIRAPMAVSPSGREVALVSRVPNSSQTSLFLVEVGAGKTEGRRLPSSNSADGPLFTPDGTRVLFTQNGYLVRQEVYSDVVENLGYLGERLLAGAGDSLMSYIGSSNSWLTYVELSGRFSFPGISLEVGDNFFSAVAEDAGGARSGSSLPIEARYVPTSVADLTVSAVLQPGMPLATDTTHAVITVSNTGTAAATNPRVAVTVVTGNGSLRPSPLAQLNQTLAAGASAVLLVPIDVTGLVGPQHLSVVVDPAHQIFELERTNNEVLKPFTVAEDTQPIVAVALDAASVPVNGTRTATMSVANPSTAPLFGEVRVDLLGAGGSVVLALGSAEFLTPLPGGEERAFTRPVAVGTLLAGDYEVRATLWRDGAVVKEDRAPLTVLPERAVLVAVSTSRTRYLTGETVEVSSDVTNTSRNSYLEGAVSVVTLRNAGGAVVGQQEMPLPLMMSGRRETRLTSFATGTLPPGQYGVTSDVRLGTQVLAQAQATFTLEGRPLFAGQVSIAGQTGSQPVVRAGQSATAELRVENRGTAPEVDATVRLVVSRPDGTYLSAGTWPLAMLAPGAQWMQQHVFSTAGWALGSYGLTLLVERSAGSEVLSNLTFQVTDGQAPRLELVNLTESMFVRETVSARVRALDDATGIAVLRAVVDGANASAVALAPLSGNALDGVWSASIPLATEGSHTLVFSAADGAGNDGRTLPSLDNPVSVTVIRDTLPPVLTVTGVPGEVPVHGPVTPVFEAQDTYLSSVTATLNGVPFTSGTAVSTDGVYELHVVATDRAGNTDQELRRFTLDTQSPRIVLGGVAPGALVNQDVTPTVSVTDLHLETSGTTVTLNGQPFTMGTQLTEDGDYLLRAQARDVAGNVAEASLSFTLDKTPPTIQVTGVSEGAQGDSFTIHFTATDLHLDAPSVLATLDGNPFTSGNTVTEEGARVLRVRASDLAGNTREVVVNFSVDSSADPLMPPFPYAVCGVQDALVYGNAEVVGPATGDKASVAANSLAYVGQNAFVSGDLVGGHSAVVEVALLSGSLYYGQGYTLGEYATVLGGIHPVGTLNPCQCSYDVMATLAQASAENDNARMASLPDSGTWWVNGAFELNGAHVALPSGRYYADHLHLSGGSTLSAQPGARVLLFVQNDVQVDTGSTLGASPDASHPMVVVTGSYHMEGESVVVNNAADASLMLYAPRNYLALSTNTTLYGALMGKTVDLSGEQRVVLKPGSQVSPPPLFCE
ncbi:CARDB domain-containing protein [Myxococcus sp. RHSTA-1-4]|uniref:CARDB domain-containing protein n=1 Tax=Myxococcus sp. RHSTA-1-4 TaxID=2874601 RepID=UPI001CBDB2D0|nr:CARDB domain-containing protein [Myxococcus sp. RHSTA-1-4]MBZ4417854.1 hypothetical protein [Myxococcus sp. RHSTA-1-4]